MVTEGLHVRRWARRLALLTLVTIFGVSDAWAASKITFNLPAGDFATAILEFYHQSNIEVLYASTLSPKTISTKAVVGELEPSEALAKMLENTGLEWEFDKDGSVLIKPKTNGGAQSGGGSAPQPVVLRASTIQYVPSKLEEVVVTGTLIHGALDVIAPVVHVTKEDLQRASYATVQDALYLLPMNSLNGPREDLPTAGNFNRGAGINLRGLGAGATLVLVNGHRQPMSGLDGDFVDVSNIAWTAVERIEVLPEGASALYGSDAIAGVVNIILRDNFHGAETQTRLAEAPGASYEKLVSQSLGTRWETGNATLAYQYSDRAPLAAADRAYASDADKTALGGGNYRTFYSNPGNILSPRNFQPAYGIPSGQAGAGLTAGALSSRINLENQFTQFDLSPERRSHNFYTAASQRVGGDRVELFAEGRFGQRDTHWNVWPNDQVLAVPRSNPYFVDPFRGSPYVLVAYSFLRDFGPTINSSEARNYVGTIGAKYMIGHDWQAILSETYGRETLRASAYNEPNLLALRAALADPNPATAFNPFGDGSRTNPATLAALRLADLKNADSGIQTTNLVADGPLFGLPGGMAKLAVGAEHRQERLTHWSTLENPGPFSRHITSTFAELSLPLVGSRTDSRAVPRLELTLAGRFEDYSDFGHVFNPQFRLRWVPLESLKLRTSWGRSFRAPKLVDLYDTTENAAGMAVFPDPQSPSGRSLVLVIQGNNPNLRQETATTWTAGVDWVPSLVSGLNVSLTYYRILYQGRIVRPGPANPFEILLQEREWAPVITHNPSRSQIDSVCNNPSFKGILANCLASLPAAIIDLRLANLAATKTAGLDLGVGQSVSSRLGTFDLGLNGSYVLQFDQAVTQTSPGESILNTVGNPLALRLRATAAWSRYGRDQPGLGFNLAVNHTGGYRNPASSLVPRVDPWTTVDLRVRYQTPKGSAWWDASEISINAVNVFNQDPPFVDGQFGYDIFNTQPYGRVISLNARKTW